MFQIFMITYLLMYRKYKQHENVKDFSYLNSVQSCKQILLPYTYMYIIIIYKLFFENCTLKFTNNLNGNFSYFF